MSKVIKWGCMLGVAMLCMNCKKPVFSLQERECISSQRGQIMRIYTIGQPEDSLFLRQKALKLTEEELNSEYYPVLKEGLLTTVKDTNNPGVGIAAPQVGISRCLIVVQRFDKAGEPFETYINPEIVYYSPGRLTGQEGCLSIPDIIGDVSRSDTVIIKYWDERKRQEIKDTVGGFTAVIFQHETDHLKGILFTDKISGNKLE